MEGGWFVIFVSPVFILRFYCYSEEKADCNQENLFENERNIFWTTF